MIPIPENIKDALGDHIIKMCEHAEEGWENANEDEDTITGDFFGSLRTGLREVDGFSWKFSYNKVRGRGSGAMEKKVGTDGIITIKYTDNTLHPPLPEPKYKSVVFQAKKVGNPIDEDQVRKMNTFFPDGNIIIIYGPDGYLAQESLDSEPVGLCALLAHGFLDCTIGVEGLRYDAFAKRFIKPDGMKIGKKISHKLLISIFKNY